MYSLLVNHQLYDETGYDSTRTDVDRIRNNVSFTVDNLKSDDVELFFFIQ